MSAKIGPYSNYTLRALVRLGKATRGICFAIERRECPVAISEQLRDVQAAHSALRRELLRDYATGSRRWLVRVLAGGLNPYPFLNSLAIICGAAALAYWAAS